MAAIKWSTRKVKNGLRVQASVRLACGHTVTEYATARTEESGRPVVRRLLDTATRNHAKECGK